MAMEEKSPVRGRAQRFTADVSRAAGFHADLTRITIFGLGARAVVAGEGEAGEKK